MMHMANMQVIEVLRSATSKSGQHLNIPLLGTIQAGAPADMIAVKGDPAHALKILEYPDLVISGGKILVNNFGNYSANQKIHKWGRAYPPSPDGEGRGEEN